MYLQKKEHSNEFLREIAHLRPRTTNFDLAEMPVAETGQVDFGQDFLFKKLV
ncbi:MAG: hypothetical protein ACQERJ_04910 [Bacillota bacterium]